MLIKIAWRNIWRNKLRSAIVVLSITFGIWAVIFLLSFSNGMINSFIERSINNELAHMQIHNPKYLDEPEIQYSIDNIDEALTKVRAIDNVANATIKTSISGMVSSAKGAQGIKIIGINPTEEIHITAISETLNKGTYLESKGKNPIIVGQKLTKKLGIKERSKVVLTFQDIEGNITTAAFKVCGVFETYNSVFDESNVFVRRSDLNKLLNDASLGHEIVMKVDNIELLNKTKADIQAALPGLDVGTYKDLSPQVELYESQIGIMSVIIIGIVMLALVFGIINTMLMAVLERYKELGILMAVGMNKAKVFMMIVLETIMISLIGAPLGLLVGVFTIYLFRSGIDLSSFSEGMRQFGLSELIYPVLTSDVIIMVTIGISITAIIAAIYPARKAIKLDPVSAIRKL